MKIQTDFYSITTYQNLIFVTVFLSWDDQVAKSCLSDLSNIVSKLFHKKPWALLADRSEWQLNIPETEHVFSDAVNTKLTKTITHSAIVVGGSGVKKWQVNKMIKNANHYEARIFDNMEEAVNWLAAFGYHM